MFNTKEEFITYLKNALIPDLRTGKFNYTADDFEEAIYWMTHPENIEGKDNEHIDREGVG